MSMSAIALYQNAYVMAHPAAYDVANMRTPLRLILIEIFRNEKQPIYIQESQLVSSFLLHLNNSMV